MPGTGKGTILVVDDEPEIGWAFAKVLGEDGHEILTAKNGKEALVKIEREQPGLVFLDVKLPGMDGLSILRKIKEEKHAQLVIMLTGHEDVKTAVEAMKLGAYDYLIKPLPNERLKIIVQHALETMALSRQVNNLSQEIAKRVTLERIIGTSVQMQRVFELVRKVATHDVTVLLRGESGTGKELIDRAIHEESPRREQPFIPIDCATLPETLVESEIFGYEKGAFTGALDRKPGRFELAQKGSLFLDEVGNLSPHVQMKLLRVLQEREVERLGGKSAIPVDVRLIAATNMGLEGLMSRGAFRDDLYHRLNVFTIVLPPLREREGDLEVLSKYFLDRFNRELSKQAQAFSEEAMALMHRYPWPGNVRELENAIKSAVILAEDRILPHHLPPQLMNASVQPQTASRTEALKATSKQAAKEAERDLIIKTLLSCHWNKAKAARRLGIDYKTLYNKMKAYGITREEAVK
ncbi:MAG: sigma-54-dependent Fis family transcriptional regulator [Deltaproteobacteria bacterium]|nr:sigma-54-dependent Fis family transcriptional regulator [Deltaproteobacteria bacterium]